MCMLILQEKRIDQLKRETKSLMDRLSKEQENTQLAQTAATQAQSSIPASVEGSENALALAQQQVWK